METTTARTRKYVAEHAFEPQARIAQYAALDAGKPAAPAFEPKPFTVLVDGQAVELHPFDARNAEPCSKCEGRGYELDCSEDGACAGPRCDACAGTGEHKFCAACVESLNARDEAPESMLAAIEVVAHNGYMRPCRRLACNNVEHLTHAMQSAARTAKYLRESIERGREANEAARAQIEAMHAETERSGLLDDKESRS